MGTRSKTSFIKKMGNKRVHMVSIYQQYDGYIEGLGYEIANYILDKKIVNGFSLGDNSNKANGFDCLVAQFIRDFKHDIGGLYITTEDNTQEYNYDVIFDEDLYYDRDTLMTSIETNDLFKIIVTDWNDKKLFEGSLKDLLEFKEYTED